MQHVIYCNEYQTNQYNWFKKLHDNREVNTKSAQYKKLLGSVQKYGQQQAILVSERGYVFEGQHRLQVCKDLRIPVVYKIVDDISIELMQELNSTQKSWSTQDYIDFHIKGGNVQLEKLMKLTKTTDMSYTELAILARQEHGGATTRSLREGSFKAINWKVIEEFLLFHKKFKSVSKRYAATGFSLALQTIWLCSKVDLNRLEEKIPELRVEFEGRKPSKDEALEGIANIYNKGFNKTNPKRIKFAYDEKKNLIITDISRYDGFKINN